MFFKNGITYVDRIPHVTMLNGGTRIRGLGGRFVKMPPIMIPLPRDVQELLNFEQQMLRDIGPIQTRKTHHET